MRIHAVAAALAALVLAAPAFAQSETPSFVGEWTATAQSPTGPVRETITVTDNGDGTYSISGQLLPGEPGADGPQGGPGTEIVLEGDSFSYKRSVGNGIQLEYSGTVDGDSFTGTAGTGGFNVPYNGVRN